MTEVVREPFEPAKDPRAAAVGLELMSELVSGFPAQLAAAPARVDGVKLRRDPIRRVVLCGMGGSAIAGELLAGCFVDHPVAFITRRDYSLPAWLGEGDLLVFSSYSGQTEETLAAWEDADRNWPGLPRLALGSGGTLHSRATAAGVPFLRLPPGAPPRASLGHGFGTLVVALDRMGILPGAEKALADAAVQLQSADARHADQKGTTALLAQHLNGRIPVIYSGSAAMHAAATRLRAQLNENAKCLAWTSRLPELDHNEVVGWGLSAELRSRLAVLALRDSGEHPRVSARFEVTREVLSGAVPAWHELISEGDTSLARALSLVQAGDWLSVHMARLAQADPMAIDAIDELKRRLEELD